jgi:membrane protease YdiL (CAAX protease family)
MLKEKLAPKLTSHFWDPVQTIILTIGVYLSSQLVASFIVLTVPLLFGVSQLGIENWLEGAVGQFTFVLLIEGFVLLLLWGLLHLKKSSFTDIGLAWPRLKDLGLAILGFGVYFLLYLIIASLAKLLFPSLNFDQEQIVGFDTARANWELILVFFSLVVMPPLVEEILARGFLYTGLKTKWPTWAAVVVTSAMFAVAHLQFGSGAPLLWIAAIDTFTLSLVLIYLREKTGNLGASIALHMLKNFVAFMLLFIFRVR